jgi:hypothetical protein
VFIVTKWEGVIDNLEKNENEEINWFTPEKARSLPFPNSLYLD